MTASLTSDGTIAGGPTTTSAIKRGGTSELNNQPQTSNRRRMLAGIAITILGLLLVVFATIGGAKQAFQAWYDLRIYGIVLIIAGILLVLGARQGDSRGEPGQSDVPSGAVRTNKPTQLGASDEPDRSDEPGGSDRSTGRESSGVQS
jgi:cytochrome c biogenesis protein CcdA